MKITLTPIVKAEPPRYPYLGKYNYGDFTVLFAGPSTGIVVEDNDLDNEDHYSVGHASDSWNESTFTRVAGTVTLTFED